MKQAAGPPKQEVALPGDRPRGEERTDSLPMAIHGLKQTTAFSPMLAAGRTRRIRAGRGGGRTTGYGRARPLCKIRVNGFQTGAVS